MGKIEYLSHSTGESDQIAEKIAAVLKPGDIIVLRGELGSGKTQFVKACLAYFEYEGPVSSPTFAIANFYRTSRCLVIHTDLYRVKSYQELSELGFDDYVPEAITFVEWGDKFTDFFDDYLTVSFDLVEDAPDHRMIGVQAGAGDWASRLEGLKDK